MKIILHFRHHIKPDKKIEKYVKEKILKLSQFNKDIMEVHTDITGGKEHTAPNKFHVSVSLHLPPKHILHASEGGQTPEAAADLVCEKLETQIKKHNHKKHISRHERKQRKMIDRIPPEEE